tara:strand:+ start:491 stop:676 length:186 start_codon:yes stop_codon:yes gene_type:complete
MQENIDKINRYRQQVHLEYDDPQLDMILKTLFNLVIIMKDNQHDIAEKALQEISKYIGDNH